MLKFVINGVELRPPILVCLALVYLTITGCGKAQDPNSRPVTEYVLQSGGKVIRVSSDLPIDSTAKIPEEDFSIREIDLTNAKIKNIDMKKLSDLPNLESLNLHGTRLNDKGLALITNLPNLKSLELAYTRVSDEEVSKLTRFPKLKKIFLYGTAVKPQTIEDLKSNLRGSVVYK
ncbi:leucine-rich repeat domain-containing protein [Gimesia aquarii]|uniref:Leucine Rich repeats (2 copies) n=1 Tax=Gimesia aquarii TaxID=2527964 RepID=A0A517VWV0_9PLAN|nr:leucine-rich repeat domain-containing protein [Gimesia aquarii]QDT97462.1 Leucine Rich repeats (2 copies) [Gimesia aquarii]